MLRIKHIVFVLLTIHASSVLAWGVEGHKTVAMIAESRLDPVAKAEVRQLLALEDATSLADVASWADQIKGTEPGLISHAVRIPFDATTYDPKRDCNRKGKCVVYGIERFEAILGQKDAPAADRLRALKFVVHYVGDIHQPLHAIKETGGVKVQLGKREYTLHKVWDTISVRSLKMSPAELASSLLAGNPSVPQRTPEQWAMESHDIAKTYIYGGNIQRADSTSMMTLPKSYLKDISPVVKTRLTDAGLRLGTLLNQVLDASHTSM
ncbi:S1/P1 nuclease [Pseudomonas sp. GL-B-19]|uniref:S1/P1 nuclease n=1 Tax=Pseudomonas sp. GL-B-19 TaxID=2832393 RepID=UPI001CBDA174|nr:S1/P1 nuclease [Pseudomonas sp. GL-B-19]